MTLMAKNADKVDETLAAIRQVIPDFKRSELHLNVGHESGHYFDNLGYPTETRHADILRAVDEHRASERHVAPSGQVSRGSLPGADRQVLRDDKSPLPCTALSSSCFIDAYWNLFACSIWDEKVGNLRENGFDLRAMWDSQRRSELRDDVVGERCSHCWTPCEAYPTILGNLARAATTRGSSSLEPLPAETL